MAPAFKEMCSPVKVRGGGYGLDAELAKKAAANYDFDLENEAKEWIEAIVKEKFPGEFGLSLKDGILLCKLVNSFDPEMIKKIQTSAMPFKQMENITNFLRACRKMGVMETDLFETVDLFELKDLGLVVRCIHALGRAVQKKYPDFQGPTLGVKEATANRRNFSPTQLAKGNSYASKWSLGSSESMRRFDMGAVYDSVTFASQIGRSADETPSKNSNSPSDGSPLDTNELAVDESQKQDKAVKEDVSSDVETAPVNVGFIPPSGMRAPPPPPPSHPSPLTHPIRSPPPPPPVANLEREAPPLPPVHCSGTIPSNTATTPLKSSSPPPTPPKISPCKPTAASTTTPVASTPVRKCSSTFDSDAEDDAREWIKAIVGEDFDGDFGEGLKDGVLLCKLVNAIKPGSVRRIETSKMPFKQMENISNFLKACRSIGVMEFDLFETVDLFEQKDIGLVIRCIHALGRTVQKNVVEFQGPTLGVKESTKNARTFTPTQIAQANACASRLNLGSSQTMDRPVLPTASTVTFGHDAARS